MNKRFWLYILISFAGAWVLQVLACTLLRPFFQIILMATMLIPMLAVLIVCKGLDSNKTGIGWKIGFKRNWKWILFAWFVPTLLSVLGALLFFVIFPGRFDPSFGYLIRSLESGGVVIKDGKLAGLPVSLIFWGSLAQAVTIAPVINGIFGAGEEIGWRGFMTPLLKARFGRIPGLILAGIIWGLWHAPLIALAGYEYGIGYWGFPLTGILLFIIVTITWGIILSFLYERSNSIWIPALFHGAINAAATLPMCLTDGTATAYPLGPAPNGLIAVIPSILLAILLLLRSPKTDQTNDQVTITPAGKGPLFCGRQAEGRSSEGPAAENPVGEGSDGDASVVEGRTDDGMPH